MPRFLLDTKIKALFRLVSMPKNQTKAPSLNGAFDVKTKLNINSLIILITAPVSVTAHLLICHYPSSWSLLPAASDHN